MFEIIFNAIEITNNFRITYKSFSKQRTFQ